MNITPPSTCTFFIASPRMVLLNYIPIFLVNKATPIQHPPPYRIKIRFLYFLMYSNKKCMNVENSIYLYCEIWKYIAKRRIFSIKRPPKKWCEFIIIFINVFFDSSISIFFSGPEVQKYTFLFGELLAGEQDEICFSWRVVIHQLEYKTRFNCTSKSSYNYVYKLMMQIGESGL